MIYNFTVLGLPIAKRRAGQNRKGKKVIVFNPQKKEEGDLIVQVAAQWQGKPLLMGPIMLTVTFYMPRPKVHYGVHGLKMSAPHHHTTKPDVDNLLKFVKDCLSKVIWVDDRQVFSILAQKFYVSGQDEQPKTIIRVEEREP